MRVTNYVRLITLTAICSFGMLLVSGCGLSAEELQQLEMKKKEVRALELQANGLKDERARIEKEIAEKNKRVEECNKLKAETQANLSKVKK
ncbi:MAG: hypothetical protein HYV28_06840 [Ignavibacteriales bacterium]|nr:hypothetical protein [Ignavibacteriales bacterium]MBI5727248.1 hypothetical protein [Ignavibacteriales bacterium]